MSPAELELDLLRSEAYVSMYAGILATIDLRNDPKQVYKDLASFEPPMLELALPHA